MKRIKNFLLGVVLMLLAISLDSLIFKENKMRKALAWVVIVALLILVVRIVSAQAFQPIERQDECIPVAVGWSPDSTNITSFGCALFRGDTLVLVHHIVNDKGGAYALIMRQQVREMYRLVVAKNPP